MADAVQPLGEEYPGEEGQSDRVRDILRTGARIFAQKGFERTSMRDISEACGISKALLYHHFESKDNLYALIAHNSAQHLYEFVYQRVPEEGTAGDKIRAFMVAMATFFDEYRWAWVASSAAFWSDPDRSRMETRIRQRKQLEGRLRDLIREGVESGEFNDVDPAMTGRLILSGINWMHRWYNPEGPMRPAEIVSAYFDTIYNGLARR
ncbi:MAG: TetR/AcrR family transcriptional regulator [Zhengella sp.]|uniref:TetR/AcrR family transcriptional regulator n=1 Tax=Zhengella sp. TaxID=2282762 RepID=UPI001DDFA4CD|nr:TetR family transcriptional regulator [Notoacmeibacter sp.]MCC0027158.1 TetR/AcrR family transcriptional regulator [Brucellaceae bacterium]